MKFNNFVNRQKEDLLKLRLMETDIHASGQVSQDFLDTLKALEDRQKGEEEEVIDFLSRHQAMDMDYRLTYEKIKMPFKDDLVYMDSWSGADFFVGAHGKILVRPKDEEEEAQELEGFDGHVLAVEKMGSGSYLLAGGDGILKRVFRKKAEYHLEDLSQDLGQDIHYMKKAQGGLLVLGSGGLRGLARMETSQNLVLVEDWTWSEETWIFGQETDRGILSVSSGGVLALGHRQVGDFGQKVHGVLAGQGDFLVYGDQGKIARFSLDQEDFVQDYEGIQGPIYQALALDPDTVLLYQSNGRAYLLHPAQGQVNQDLDGLGSYISSARQMEEGSLLLGGWNGFAMRARASKPESFQDYMDRYKESIGWA